MNKWIPHTARIITKSCYNGNLSLRGHSRVTPKIHAPLGSARWYPSADLSSIPRLLPCLPCMNERRREMTLRRCATPRAMTLSSALNYTPALRPVLSFFFSCGWTGSLSGSRKSIRAMGSSWNYYTRDRSCISMLDRKKKTLDCFSVFFRKSHYICRTLII